MSMGSVSEGGRPELASWEAFEASTGARDKRSQAAFDFQARWRFASSFEGVNAVGYKTSEIVDSYGALIRLLLVCTAREQLAVLLDRAKHELVVEDRELAARIRDDLYGNGRFADALCKDATPGAVRRLDDFWSGESSDVQVVAFAIRHGVAHGFITPTGARIRSSKQISVISDLGECLLQDSDAAFTSWVEAR